MKKTSILYSFAAIALCAFTFGCQSEKTSESVIDLEATAREPKPFTQSDLPGTVSFIPLETTDSSLIGMSANIQVSANRILVSSTNQPLLVFDKKTGRFLNQIGQKGEGPEGYADDGFGNLFYWLDQQQEVVYLLGINGHSLLRYDLSGRFLGKTTLPEGTPESPNLYSSYLFIFNDTIIAHNKYISEDSIPSLICFSGTNGQSIGQFLHKPLSCPLSARLKSPIICTAVSCLTEGIFRHSTSATERLTAFPLKLQPSGKTRDRPISKRPSAIPSSGYNPTEHLLSIKSCT